MQCQRCGKELGDSARCTFCGYYNTVGSVREMSAAEKYFYDGVTIKKKILPAQILTAIKIIPAFRAGQFILPMIQAFFQGLLENYLTAY